MTSLPFRTGPAYGIELPTVAPATARYLVLHESAGDMILYRYAADGSLVDELGRTTVAADSIAYIIDTAGRVLASDGVDAQGRAAVTQIKVIDVVAGDVATYSPPAGRVASTPGYHGGFVRWFEFDPADAFGATLPVDAMRSFPALGSATVMGSVNVAANPRSPDAVWLPATSGADYSEFAMACSFYFDGGAVIARGMTDNTGGSPASVPFGSSTTTLRSGRPVDGDLSVKLGLVPPVGLYKSKLVESFDPPDFLNFGGRLPWPDSFGSPFVAHDITPPGTTGEVVLLRSDTAEVWETDQQGVIQPTPVVLDHADTDGTPIRIFPLF